MHISGNSFHGLCSNAPYFTNSGTFNNSGALNNNGSTMTNSGTSLNAGTVTISSSGLFTTGTNYTQTAGSTLVNGTLAATGGAIVNIQGGTVGGTGKINGNVEVAGTMMPGAPGTPGTLTIFGNYEQTGTGIFEEFMSSLARAFLNVNGDVMLDSGSLLDITLLERVRPLRPDV